MNALLMLLFATTGGLALSGIVASVDGGGFGGNAEKFTVRLASGAEVVIPADALKPGNVLAVVRKGGMSGANVIGYVGPHKQGQVFKDAAVLLGPGQRVTVTGTVRACGNRAALDAETVRIGTKSCK